MKLNGMTKGLVVMLLAALIVSVVSATVWQYVIHKPSSLHVEVNLWGIELYADQMPPTTIAASIVFPDVAEGQPTTTTTTQYYYLFLTTDDLALGKNTRLMWTVDGLPVKCTLKAYIKAGSVLWPANTEVDVLMNGIHETTSGNGVRVYWLLDFNNLAAGDYAFTINIYSVEPTP